MVITINGRPGSGKSTVAQRLAETLKVPRLYVGDFWRRLAREQGVTLLEMLHRGEDDPSFDKAADDWLVAEAHRAKNCVAETRTGFYFLPESLKIFLDVDEREAAQRIFNGLKHEDNRDTNEDRGLESEQAVLHSIRARVASEQRRYSKLYGIDIFDPKHYDLFLDTTELDKGQVFDKVLAFVSQHGKIH